jgi:hypothetical protein
MLDRSLHAAPFRDETPGAFVRAGLAPEDRAGYLMASLEGRILFFGGLGGEPSADSLAAELCGPSDEGLCLEPPGTPPLVRQWSNPGVEPERARRFAARAHNGPYWFIAGGQGEQPALDTLECSLR